MVSNLNIIFNGILLLIFTGAVSMFIYSSYLDNKKYTKDYTLRKLLFIKKNT